MTAESVFLQVSEQKLRQHAENAAKCLDMLTYDQIWLRTSDANNAVGNLVLHLCGNLRQWIGAGVGGRADIRVRDREFAARGDIEGADLKERLLTMVDDMAVIIANTPPERLTETIHVQGQDRVVLDAIYQVVQHFALHIGQIQFATKQFTGQDLGFFRDPNRPAKP